MAAKILLTGGHRRIAFIGGYTGLPNTEDRKHGFMAHLKQSGFELWNHEETDGTYEGGYAAAMRILSSVARPDAIFCSNDMVAIGVIDAARQEFDLLIPDDISVLGFDNLPMAA